MLNRKRGGMSRGCQAKACAAGGARGAGPCAAAPRLAVAGTATPDAMHRRVPPGWAPPATARRVAVPGWRPPAAGPPVLPNAPRGGSPHPPRSYLCHGLLATRDPTVRRVLAAASTGRPRTKDLNAEGAESAENAERDCLIPRAGSPKAPRGGSPYPPRYTARLRRHVGCVLCTHRPFTTMVRPEDAPYMTARRLRSRRPTLP